MTFSGVSHHFSINTKPFQCVIEFKSLASRDSRVLLTVEQEGGRLAFCDVADWRLFVVGSTLCVRANPLKPKIDGGIPDARSADKAEEIRNPCNNYGSFKSGSTRYGIHRCIATIAPSSDTESIGVGNTFGHEVIHAIQKVLNGQSTPVGTHIMKLYSSPYHSPRVW